MGRKFKIIQIWERFCCMGCRDHIVDQLLGLSLSRCAVEHPNGTGGNNMDLIFSEYVFYDLLDRCHRPFRLQHRLRDCQKTRSVYPIKIELHAQIPLQLPADLFHHRVSNVPAEDVVNIGKFSEHDAHQHCLDPKPVELRDPLQGNGKVEQSGDRIHLRLIFQADHAPREKQRLCLILIPLHDPPAVQPGQLSIFVIDSIADAVTLPLFPEHGPRILDMHLLVRPIDALLQQRYKIGNNIPREAEVLL